MITKDGLLNYYESNRVIIKMDGFAYLLPHHALRDWISNYTITFPTIGMMANSYSIIPHGCATLVLSCTDGGIYGNLFGPTTKPVCVGSEANLCRLLFIIEFQPAGYYAFSGMPQKELTDIVIPFETVNPALNRLIVQQIETATDIYNLITVIDKLFLAHLKTAFYRDEFSTANKMIINSGGQISVKELSQNVYYSERHLSRIFGEYIGVNIKSFSRLVRMNKAIRILRQPHFSITQAYLQNGYYDMPHFIHDFKSICGITPQEYRENLSDFYSEIAKF